MHLIPILVLAMLASACASPAATPSESRPAGGEASEWAATSAPSSPTVSAEPALSDSPGATPAALSGDLRHVATLSRPGERPSVIAAWRGGFVALGPDMGWTSGDGREWKETGASGLEDSYLMELTERGDGTLLALGYHQASDPGGVFRAWTSENGTHWTMTDLDFTDSFILRGFAHGPRGYVVSGRQVSDEGNNEGLWFSADGISWQLTLQPGDSRSISAVAAGPQGFVAVGQQDWSMTPPRAYVVASSDGMQWFEADPSDAALSSTGGVWGVAPLGPDWLAAPSASGAALPVLRSATGLAWELASSLAIDPPVEAGFVADMFGDGARVLIDVPNAEFLWASADGLHWQLTEVPVEAPGGGGQIRGATASGVTVVLVGDRVYAGTTTP